MLAYAAAPQMQLVGRARSNASAIPAGRFGCARVVAWSPIDVLDVTTVADKHVGPRRTSVSTP